jgi:hypothetical protein
MKRIPTAIAAVAIMAISHNEAGAQARTPARARTISGVNVGYSDLGFVLGLGGTGGADIAIGGRFEKVFKPLPDLGNGMLGVQVGMDWWSWSDSYNYPGGSGRASATIIPIGVTANYHFNVEDKRFDPLFGLGLGYEIANADACVVYLGTQYCNTSVTYDSGIYLIAKAGLRYFLSPGAALYAELGTGAADLSIGATIRMGR